eukprot:2333901-Prymnesium_polylepis.1
MSSQTRPPSAVATEASRDMPAPGSGSCGGGGASRDMVRSRWQRGAAPRREAHSCGPRTPHVARSSTGSDGVTRGHHGSRGGLACSSMMTRGVTR